MTHKQRLTSLIYFIFLFGITNVSAQNPIVRNLFTADPSAHVFGDKIYVFPSHDESNMGKGRPDWFVMEDYHVFSSKNLTDWTDHGMIVSQYDVDWVDTTTFSMWAPDCVEKDGKYYFYFPAKVKAKVKNTGPEKGFSIGLAIADKPEGPYTLQSSHIKGLKGIDPCVFIDNDGQAYLYWASGDIFVAKLKENMLELATEALTIPNLPDKGLKEGPFMFERNGKYYLTYPHVRNKTESLEYAMGDNPMGPFEVKGVIMDASPTGCWTNHQSVLNFNEQWYLFYHHNDYSPQNDKNRSICADSLSFNIDGTIRKISPTLRGIGVTQASVKIQIDRYSKISQSGASIDFMNLENTFEGWKIILDKDDVWVQYNAVNFGNAKYKTLQIKAVAQNGSMLELRIGSANGQLLAKIAIPKSQEWQTIKLPLKTKIEGIQNLVLIQKDKRSTEVDWLRFVK